jgi:2-polyprenyl-6-methoxyphenol hydroxylase-like FAD-dependent oxidoreductase
MVAGCAQDELVSHLTPDQLAYTLMADSILLNHEYQRLKRDASESALAAYTERLRAHAEQVIRFAEAVEHGLISTSN